MKEITFDYNIEKPFTQEELQYFKVFRIEIKALVKTGNVKIQEKFKVYTITITDYSVADKNQVTTFMKKYNLKIKTG